MEKKTVKKLILIIIAAGMLLMTLCIIAGIGLFQWIMGSDTRSDQYLEQMIEAAETDSSNVMMSMYLRDEVGEEEIEKDIQALLKIWNRKQPYTYKKTGYQMNSNSSNSIKVKTTLSNFVVTTQEGEKLSVSMRWKERDGKAGLTDFTISTMEAVKPVGRIGTMGRWNLFQWVLFAFSLIIIACTIATAVDCYRRSPRYRWGWIALILLAYATPGFSIMHESARRTLSFHFSAAIVGLSKYMVSSHGDIKFSLYLPAGMVIYWILRKRLTPFVNGGPKV